MKTLIADRLKPISIPDLSRMAEQTLRVEVEGYFTDLNTLTPITATLSVQHKGTFLELGVTANAIVTLTCDRCLGQYNHRLAIENQEFIWLKELGVDLPLEFPSEWGESDLVESLPAQGHCDLAQWLYEQLCLGLPSQQRCDQNCPGFESITPEPSGAPETNVDQRWAALAQLQNQLSTSSPSP